VIGPGLAFFALGLGIFCFLGLNLGNTATRLAADHASLRRRIPRYYAMTDWWRLSEKPMYWQWYGGIVGAVFGLVGFIGVLSALRSQL
jgi:hypothetical protein